MYIINLANTCTFVGLVNALVNAGLQSEFGVRVPDKIGPFRQGCTIVLGRGSPPLCALEALVTYMYMYLALKATDLDLSSCKKMASHLLGEPIKVIKFRNYVPKDETLKDKKIPDAKPLSGERLQGGESEDLAAAVNAASTAQGFESD
ncbi:hypothetical protein QZH41_001886 [Actinostola sp. cb2023]|nr:hypothetical protein QZH41_001886 [Actinostola sp. cb2023]